MIFSIDRASTILTPAGDVEPPVPQATRREIFHEFTGCTSVEWEIEIDDLDHLVRFSGSLDSSLIMNGRALTIYDDYME